MRPRYLRPALTMPQIYLYRAPIDFRKQAHGLAALVEQQLGHNPFTGALYAFTNRRRNKIKCLIAYINYVLAQIGEADSLEKLEALLPWNVPLEPIAKKVAQYNEGK